MKIDQWWFLDDETHSCLGRSENKAAGLRTICLYPNRRWKCTVAFIRQASLHIDEEARPNWGCWERCGRSVLYDCVLHFFIRQLFCRHRSIYFFGCLASTSLSLQIKFAGEFCGSCRWPAQFIPHEERDIPQRSLICSVCFVSSCWVCQCIPLFLDGNRKQLSTDHPLLVWVVAIAFLPIMSAKNLVLHLYSTGSFSSVKRSSFCQPSLS